MILGRTKSSCQNLEGFDAAVEGFMTCLGTLLQLRHFFDVKRIAATNCGLFRTAVDPISNDAFARWYLTFESAWFSIDLEVSFASRKRSINPNKVALEHSNSQFVGKTSLLELETEPGFARSASRLRDSAVDSIHSADEAVVWNIISIERPNNLTNMAESEIPLQSFVFNSFENSPFFVSTPEKLCNRSKYCALPYLPK